MKKSVLSLLLICILIFSAGCQAQKGPEGGTGLLSGDELELYTSQFGLPLEQVKENLSFSDLKLTDEVHGTWEVSEKRTINGLEFSLNLIENPFDNSLYEYVYGCSLLDDNARETGFSIASQAMEIYGAPSTYPGISTRILTEEGELKEPEPSEDEFSET